MACMVKFKNEGFVMVSPGVHDLGTDKDKELSDLKKLVDRMQAELFDLDELKKERDELKNLTIALENQVKI